MPLSSRPSLSILVRGRLLAPFLSTSDFQISLHQPLTRHPYKLSKSRQRMSSTTPGRSTSGVSQEVEMEMEMPGPQRQTQNQPQSVPIFSLSSHLISSPFPARPNSRHRETIKQPSNQTKIRSVRQWSRPILFLNLFLLPKSLHSSGILLVTHFSLLFLFPT